MCHLSACDGFKWVVLYVCMCVGVLELVPPLPLPETQMMSLLLPLYISLLIDPTSRSVTPELRQIHDYILQQVTQIGPKYPGAFRSVMQTSPALKQKLESAIRASQSPSKAVRTQASRSAGRQHQPSIKLKMDFSNFK